MSARHTLGVTAGGRDVCYNRPVESVLLKDLRSKKSEAIRDVVNEHTEVLLRAAFGLGLPESEAEELVQQTFVTFLEVVGRFEGRSTVRTFLFGILYRKAMERSRKRSRELATDPVDQVFEKRFGAMGMWASVPRGPDEEALTKETGVLIRECLEGLPETQRAAFYLREVERESAESIRNILEVSDTNLRVLMFRARNKLRECLEKRWEERR